MFTTPPSLAQRMERLIEETRIIDPHTHLRCDQPSAPDLSALLNYHWVQTELRAVGLPETDRDAALPADERVRRALPFLARMRNTATAWCLGRIFRDLYGFAEPELTTSNYRDLFDRVAACGRDPSWPQTVLHDRCHIETFVTSLGNQCAEPRNNPETARFMLDAHYLFCPGVATDLEPFFSGRTSKLEYVDALRQVLGEPIDTPDRLARRLYDWLGATVTGPVRFTNTFIPIGQRFTPPDVSQVRSVLIRATTGGALSEVDIDELARFVTWNVLAWHHENHKAVQIAVGAEYFICDGKSIPRFQETWTSEMARAFHYFSGARFDLMMASDVLSHEVAVLARQFPNVYLSGYWWHNFFPETIERIIRLRVQIAPMVKIGGFLSDAYSAEWTYGKLQVVKTAMASALAKLVESGFYEEDAVPALLRQILHDTPRDLYELA